MVECILLQLAKFRQTHGTLGFSDGTDQDDNACTGSNSMNNLYIQLGFERPATAIIVWVIWMFIERRDDFNRNRWKTKLLVEYIHICLQRRTAKRNDIDDRLSLTCKAPRDKRFHAIGDLHGMRRLAVWRST